MKNFFQTNIQWSVLIVLLTFSFVATAQTKKLHFSNGQQTEIQGNATINISTGDITVQPVTNKLIVDEPASQKALVSIKTDSDLSALNVGDSIDVSWTVAFAKDIPSCTASVSPIGSAAWAGNKSTANGTYTQNGIAINALPATLLLTCNNYNTGTVSDSFTVRKATGSGGTTTNPPVIDSFYSVPQMGTSHNLIWNVTNADTCTGLSNPTNSGWNNVSLNSTSGTKNVTVTVDTAFTLRCANNGGTVNKVINVTGSGGGGTPPSCTGVNVLTPPGLTAQTYRYTDPYIGGLPVPLSLPNVNGFGADFKDIDNIQKQMVMQINPSQRYISISDVKIPNSVFRHKFTFNSSPGFGEASPATFSFSECPGDFNPQTAQCVAKVSGNTVFLTTDPSNPYINNPGVDNACLLQKGKTYYLNFVFAQPYDGPSTCQSPQGGKCAIFWGEKAW